jgi:hypothetical protein
MYNLGGLVILKNNIYPYVSKKVTLPAKQLAGQIYTQNDDITICKL